MHWKRKYELTKEQEKMYSSEKLMNFRLIGKVMAKKSLYVLSTGDLAPPHVAEEVSHIGQFSEIVYSAVPFEFVFEKAELLSKPGYPLDGYPIIQECTLVRSCKGELAGLPAYVAYRPSAKQLIVAISGTQGTLLAFHDLRALQRNHPSGMGKVHSGFWGLYKGIRQSLAEAIAEALEKHDVQEVVITGHSLGGAVSYLLCLDLLRASETESSKVPLLPKSTPIKLVIFGAPRAGDQALVNYWRTLVALYREANGQEAFTEYTLKAYNDGVPALPPAYMGYYHFSDQPYYLDKSLLFRVPPAESENAFFAISPDTISPASSETKYAGIQFPRGGHNYYNDRDMERLVRRLRWLAEADYARPDWESRYEKILSKRL